LASLPEFIVSIAIMIVLVGTARYLALRKGRSRLGWMWATAFFGPIPVLVLALLPSKLNSADEAI
jgi:hypothetical protein